MAGMACIVGSEYPPWSSFGDGSYYSLTGGLLHTLHNAFFPFLIYSFNRKDHARSCPFKIP